MGEAGRGTYEAPRLGVRFRPSRERTGACPFCLLHSLPALPAMNRFHTLAAALAATLLASCGDTSNAAASASEAATASLSASSLAKRADCLLKLDRPAAAVADCDAALNINHGAGDGSVDRIAPPCRR